MATDEENCSVKQYKVVKTSNTTLLAYEIEELLSLGWELWGSLIVVPGMGPEYYAQAMISRKEIVV